MAWEDLIINQTAVQPEPVLAYGGLGGEMAWGSYGFVDGVASTVVWEECFPRIICAAAGDATFGNEQTAMVHNYIYGTEFPAVHPMSHALIPNDGTANFVLLDRRIRVRAKSFGVANPGSYSIRCFGQAGFVFLEEVGDPDGGIIIGNVIADFSDETNGWGGDFVPGEWSPWHETTVLEDDIQFGADAPFFGIGAVGVNSDSDSPPNQYLVLEWQIWVDEPDSEEDLNCDCDCTYERATLLEMYQRVMRRMGYGAQLARPPPGNKETVFDYIREAQALTMADFDEIGHKRFFKWNMAIGQRFYGVDENDDVCGKLLNHLTIMGVWIRRGGPESGNFMRLVRKEPVIDPEYFSGGIHNSTPVFYTVRQCIEVWPPPSEEMELIILGKYKNLPLIVDGDFTTADPEAIFLRAVALYKSDKGHANAGTYKAEYDAYIGNVNADTFRDTTLRFIPPWANMRACDWDDFRGLTRVMNPLVYG